MNPHMAECFRVELDGVRPGWQVRGNGLADPRGVAVELLADTHSDYPGHVDVRFFLDERQPELTGLLDCVAGFGSDDLEMAESAAKIWVGSTATALYELRYSGRGEFADHYAAGDPIGFPGWHAVHSGIVGYGTGDASGLQKWWLANPVLPTIAPSIAAGLDRGRPHGIKIFFGAEGTGEVRLDGEVHDAATELLLAQPWPRSSEFVFVRGYAILVHPEPLEA